MKTYIMFFKLCNFPIVEDGDTCWSHKVWSWIHCQEPCDYQCKILPIFGAFGFIGKQGVMITLIYWLHDLFIVMPLLSSYLKSWENSLLSSSMHSANSLLVHLGFLLEVWQCWIQSWPLWERYNSVFMPISYKTLVCMCSMVSKL